MIILLIILSFIAGIEYQKIKECSGVYDYDTGVCK